MPDEPTTAKAPIILVTVPGRPIIGAQTPITERWLTKVWMREFFLVIAIAIAVASVAAPASLPVATRMCACNTNSSGQ